ncbi:MAG: HAMP domain-containing histidine kinase, partial [Alphaproteobacteria bacterium]|nr:HAMP domain-containing histidine kinase [Alphaproteobacteria bacterium]
QHDLRNILASAQLASDRLSAINDPVVQRLAPRLITALDRAVGLATNTLRYGRADERPAVRRKVLLAPIVDEAAEAALAIRGGAGRKVRLHNEVSQTCQAYADPEHLHRIVLNLLRNAAQALQTQDDGAITVSTDESAGRLVITIADNGPGIMPELQDRLFKPFAAGARNGGSGLGLAIARDLARAQGGDVSLVATGTAGTVFRIELPGQVEGV